MIYGSKLPFPSFNVLLDWMYNQRVQFGSPHRSIFTAKPSLRLVILPATQPNLICLTSTLSQRLLWSLCFRSCTTRHILYPSDSMCDMKEGKNEAVASNSTTWKKKKKRILLYVFHTSALTWNFQMSFVNSYLATLEELFSA